MPSAATQAALSSDLRLAVMRLTRRLRAQRSDTSLTISQLAALATLDRHGPLTPGELAVFEKVQPPSMTRVVAAMEERGLVARTPHPSDRRQSLLTASPTGRALLAEDRRRKDAWLAQRLAELSAEERSTLRAAAGLLDRLAGS